MATQETQDSNQNTLTQPDARLIGPVPDAERGLDTFLYNEFVEQRALYDEIMTKVDPANAARRQECQNRQEVWSAAGIMAVASMQGRGPEQTRWLSDSERAYLKLTQTRRDMYQEIYTEVKKELFNEDEFTSHKVWLERYTDAPQETWRRYTKRLQEGGVGVDYLGDEAELFLRRRQAVAHAYVGVFVRALAYETNIDYQSRSTFERIGLGSPDQQQLRLGIADLLQHGNLVVDRASFIVKDPRDFTFTLHDEVAKRYTQEQ